MKKLLLFNLLLAMTFVTTSLKAATDDVFTANVTVVDDGVSKQVPMRFKVISESDKTCWTYATYDEVSGSHSPAVSTSVDEVVIPETANGYTVTGIGSYSFNGCYFTNITIPQTVSFIGNLAFFQCWNLKEIDIPQKVVLGYSTFSRCERLTHVSISCDQIPSGCFNECSQLYSIELLSPVKSVGFAAFAWCSALVSITFPAGLELIEEQAFLQCVNLRSVVLPSSLTKIDASAFFECTSLRDVVIAGETPPTIIPWGDVQLFTGINEYALLTVPDRTKYTSESWASNFYEIRSFLPTNEKTYGFYNLGASGWGWIVYTNDPNKVLDLKIDGEPKAPTFYGTDIIVSDDPKQIPLEVSYLLKTDEGIQPNIIHYDLFDYGFSIDGKEMTSRDFYNVPGVVSGKAYIKDEFVLGGENHLHWKKEPKLVLENATLEWNDALYGLYNHDTGQAGLTIKVIGDCSIIKKNHIALELDVATNTYIVGGGTLKIYSSDYHAIRTWAVTNLTIKDNTTVIAKSDTDYGLYDEDGARIEIKDGGVFAVYGKNEPITYENAPILGEGIALRYPVDAYIGNYYVYNADGTKVQGDWVVIGPDNQTTQDFITGVDNVNADDNLNQNKGVYNLSGQKVGEGYKGIVIKDGKKIIKK